MECLLSFGAESFVFQFAIQKCEGKYIQNYNFPGVLYMSEIWLLTMKGNAGCGCLRFGC